MAIKHYILQHTTYYDHGTLMMSVALYERVLPDGTDLGWSYSVGRDPLYKDCGNFDDADETRKRVKQWALEHGIDRDDIDSLHSL